MLPILNQDQFMKLKGFLESQKTVWMGVKISCKGWCMVMYSQGNFYFFPVGSKVRTRTFSLYPSFCRGSSFRHFLSCLQPWSLGIIPVLREVSSLCFGSCMSLDFDLFLYGKTGFSTDPLLWITAFHLVLSSFSSSFLFFLAALWCFKILFF